MTARSFPVAERRARLARRHHLAPAHRTDDVAEIAGDVVGLHATDGATVHLSATARQRTPSVASVEAALYESRSVVRMLGMRRTMWVEPRDLAAVVATAASAAVAARERARVEKAVEELGVAGDGAAWLDAARAEVLAALDTLGEATGAELTKAAPSLAVKVRLNEGKRYEAETSLTTWVLNGMSAEGLVVRGRPRGSWLSTQYRWSSAATWLGAPLPSPAPEAARTELARRWLRAFGPAPLADLQWWTGWGKRQTAGAVAPLAVVEVDAGGTAAVALADDLEPEEPAVPWAALLPSLDPTVMGWSERSWYLGDHRAALFDRFGNAGPTVWWDGRVVGGWGVRAGGEVVLRMLEDVGADAAAAIDAEVGRLVAVLGGVKVTPRFRTPLELELSR